MTRSGTFKKNFKQLFAAVYLYKYPLRKSKDYEEKESYCRVVLTFLQNPTTVGWCRLRRSLCLNSDSKFSCRRRCCKFASALFSCKGQENVNKEERQFERPRDKNIRNQNVKINSYFSREYNGENKMWKLCKLHKKAKNH